MTICLSKLTCTGEEFRREFSCLGELRSILPYGVHILAITATTTVSLRKCVIKMLGMIDTKIVSENVDKPNIIHSVLPFKLMEAAFKAIIDRLRNEHVCMPMSILCCKSRDKCAQLYLFMKLILKKNGWNQSVRLMYLSFISLIIYECYTCIW